MSVGVATTVIGGALALAPGRVGPLAGLTEARATRLIGLADLALVPGLLAGRPRWPWMAARAGLNVAIAAYAIGLSGRDDAAGRARAGGIALLAITAADAAVTLQLRAAGR